MPSTEAGAPAGHKTRPPGWPAPWLARAGFGRPWPWRSPIHPALGVGPRSARPSGSGRAPGRPKNRRGSRALYRAVPPPARPERAFGPARARPTRAGLRSGGQAPGPPWATPASAHGRRHAAGPRRRAPLGVRRAVGGGRPPLGQPAGGAAAPGRRVLGPRAGQVEPGRGGEWHQWPAGPGPSPGGPARVSARDRRPEVGARVEPGVAPWRTALGGAAQPYGCRGGAGPRAPRRLAGAWGGPGATRQRRDERLADRLGVSG